MIIACPACKTRYVVPDSAIGVDGRTVRCAKCRHSWFQDGPVVEAGVALAPPAADRPPPVVQTPAPPSPQQDHAIARPDGMEQPVGGRVAESPAFPPEKATETAAVSAAPDLPPARPPLYPSDTPSTPPAGVAAENGPSDQMAENSHFDDVAEPATVPEWRHTAGLTAPKSPEISQFDSDADDGPSPFASEPPFQPRRNPVRVRNWLAGACAAAVLAIGAAFWYFGAPDWLAFRGPAFAEPNDLVLDFPAQRQDRRTLPNGTEYFGASGTITNTGKETRAIPQILIVLRDAQERVVYTSELAPPKAELAPGETVTINEALTDVPRAASIAEIGWKDEG